MRPPFGWDGRDYYNGSEADWMRDFEIEMALLDRMLAVGNMYLARPLIQHLANGFVQMDLDATKVPSYWAGCKTIAMRYHRASVAIFHHLKRDNRRRDPIITPKCYKAFIDWAVVFLYP